METIICGFRSRFWDFRVSGFRVKGLRPRFWGLGSRDSGVRG